MKKDRNSLFRLKSPYVLLFALLCFTIGMTACNKELAGERTITGDWEVREVLVNNVDVTSKADTLGILKYSFTYILNADSGFCFTSGKHFLGSKWTFGIGENSIIFESIDTINTLYDQRVTGSLLPMFVDSISVSYDEDSVATYTNSEFWSLKFETNKEMILSKDYDGSTYVITLDKIKNFSLDRKE